MDDLENLAILTEDSDDPPVLYYALDLTRPVQGQLDRIKKDVKDKLKTRGKKLPLLQLYGDARINWPRHLRIIDAKDQGATHEQIYAQFVEEWSRGDE